MTGVICFNDYSDQQPVAMPRSNGLKYVQIFYSCAANIILSYEPKLTLG